MIEIHYRKQPFPQPNQPWSPSVHGVISREDGAILLHRRDDHDFWTYPGGKLELGESLEACLQREMAEETGLDVVAEKLLGVFSSPEYSLSQRDKVFQPLLVVFLCRVQSGNLHTGPESRSFIWMDRKNIATLNTFPLTKEIAEFLWNKAAEAFFNFRTLGIR